MVKDQSVAFIDKLWHGSNNVIYKSFIGIVFSVILISGFTSIALFGTYKLWKKLNR